MIYTVELLNPLTCCIESQLVECENDTELLDELNRFEQRGYEISYFKNNRSVKK